MDNITPVDPGNALSLQQAFERLSSQGNPQPEQAEKAAPEGETPESELADPTNTETTETPEGESPPESEQSLPTTLKLPDGTEITADEAVKGYLRESDYTRKTQALSQKEKQADARVENAVQQLATVYQELTSQLDKEPDWEKVAQDRPLDWQLEKLAWDRKQGNLQKARQQAEEVYKQHTREAQGRMVNALTSGEYDPAWVNRSAFEADVGKLVKDFQARGIPPQRIDSILDPVEFMVAIDAMRYRELQSKKPEIKREVQKSVEAPRPKALQPGSRTQQQRVPEKVKQAEARFQQSRGIHEAYDMLIARRGKSA